MARETNSGDEQKSGLELPPAKESYFELQGKKFHSLSGYTAFFEETKTLPFFDEIHESWKRAIRTLNVGTPRGLNADSIAEQELLELFFIELRYGDPGLTFTKYSPLIQKRPNDHVFWTAVTRTINRRSIPNDAPLSLPFYILATWIHSFLWGLSNEERADTLCRAYGVTIHSAVGGEPEVVRKTIAKLKLSRSSNYRTAHS